jgi:hypothetical protein
LKDLNNQVITTSTSVTGNTTAARAGYLGHLHDFTADL